MLLAIGCSSGATGSGGGGGGGAPVPDGEAGGGGGQRGVWGQQRGGSNWGEGSTLGVSSTSKNRPSQHKYKSPKQFELKQS